MRFLSTPRKSPEPLDAPDVLAEGFFHTSTRLQLTLKTHRSKWEHMQRSGRKLWYCRSPETRPRNWNKSLQAQVGLMWCLGPMLTSAEEWVIPTASWQRASLKERAGSEALPLAATYSPGLFSVPRDSRWSNAHELHCSQPMGSHSLPKPLTAKLWEHRHLFSLSFPYPPHTYSTQSNPSAAQSAELRKDGNFLMSNVKSHLAKCSFLTIL